MENRYDQLTMDEVISVKLNDVEDGHLIFRLDSVEAGSLKTSAESDELVDSRGATVSKLYKSKKASFTGDYSFFDTNLYAEQLGAKKEIATASEKIDSPREEIKTAKENKIALAATPKTGSVKVYKMSNGSIMTQLKLSTGEVEAGSFSINASEITLETGATGSYYIEYVTESETAIKIDNKTNQFPRTAQCTIFATFRDKCNDNIIYTGAIIAQRAKLDPSSIEKGLGKTDKQSFAIDFNKNYCDSDSSLFSVIIDK